MKYIYLIEMDDIIAVYEMILPIINTSVTLLPTPLFIEFLTNETDTYGHLG